MLFLRIVITRAIFPCDCDELSDTVSTLQVIELFPQVLNIVIVFCSRSFRREAVAVGDRIYSCFLLFGQVLPQYNTRARGRGDAGRIVQRLDDVILCQSGRCSVDYDVLSAFRRLDLFSIDRQLYRHRPVVVWVVIPVRPVCCPRHNRQHQQQAQADGDR